MSGSQEDADSRTQNITGWTLVSSQGEVMSTDEDSESSESSIEVVSIEENEVVLHKLQRGWSTDPVAASPTTECSPEESKSSLQEVVDGGEVTFGCISEGPEEAANLQCVTGQASLISEGIEETTNSEHLIEQSTLISEASPDISSAQPVKTHLTLSESFKSQNELPSHENDLLFDGQEVVLPGDGGEAPASVTQPQLAPCEVLSLVSSTTASDQIPHPDVDEDVPEIKAKFCMKEVDAAGDFSDGALSALQEEEKGNPDLGACCLELLLQSRETQPVPAADSLKSPVHAPTTSELASVSQVSCVKAAGSTHSRSDSDTDSDFVRLDSESIDAYVGEHQNTGERVVIPLRLYRTSSSIGPSFSFMRDHAGAASQEEYSPDLPDQDGDEDTESSTEEAVDDRIESEQSEAGSLSAQNDVGDLSVFADIGDLPLVAGDVPRNYIHRPNNRLSTVLNVIVVLVAILTMGISLGIIMATDLEIEEWQNAHEFQTKRVSQLELVLQSKSKANELQHSRIKELEAQLGELKGSNRVLEKRVSSYERAMDLLASYSSEEGEIFEKALQIAHASVKDYAKCKEESNELIMGDCHLKIVPYFKIYTSLMKDDPVVKLPDALHSGRNAQNVNVKMPVEEINLNTHHPLSPSTENMDSSQKDPRSQSKPEPINRIARMRTAENDDLSTSGQSQTSYINSEDGQNEHAVREKGIRPPSAQSDFTGEGLSSEKPQTSNIVFESTQTKHVMSDHGSRLSSLRTDYIDEKRIKAEDKIQAFPIPIDIRQLQQSLTREQERALHWQQLYLSERRQKERERENEELEDEREREMEEREREQIDQVECLRKLMSANLTTLTKHVARWNVSVFDDFANLSMLLSGIAELQQSVISSVQRVWESAEEVIDSLQAKDKPKEGKTWENTIPKKEMIAEYLSQLADRVKKVDMPDRDIIVEFIGRMLDQVKQSVDGVLNQVYAEYVTNSVYKVWENAQVALNSFQDSVEGMVDGRKDGSSIPDKGHLLEYLSKALNDICREADSTSHETGSAHMDSENEPVNGHSDPDGHKTEKSFEYKDFGDHSYREPDFEEDNPKRGFWYRKIGKMLKRTSKTVRKIGRKVAGTWDKIKTIWHERKLHWHKLRTMWHEKKSAFFNMAKGYSSPGSQAPSKSVRICTKLPENLFLTSETFEVDINSKCVHKLRKQWQKIVMRDPCKVLGKFSFECNSGRKQCKRDINKMSDSFSHLLKIPNFKLDEILKMDTDDLKAIHKQFKSFQAKWGERKLLLKTDMKWVECQLFWWSAALSHRNVDKLMENVCGIINLTENFHGEQQAHTFGPHPPYGKESEDYLDDDDDDGFVTDDYDEDDYTDHEEGDHHEILKEVGLGKYDNKAEVDRNKDNEYDFHRETVDDESYENDDGEDSDDNGKHDNQAEVNTNKAKIDRVIVDSNNKKILYFIYDSNNKKIGRVIAQSEDDECAVLKEIYDKDEDSDEDDDIIKEEKASKVQEENAAVQVADAELGKDDEEVNETTSKDDWYLQRAKHRLQQREEKHSDDWLSDQAASREEEERLRRWGNIREDKEKEIPSLSDWVFEKAKDREQQREESGRSYWLFERAENRRENFHKKWAKDHEEEKPHFDHRSQKRWSKELNEWYLKQAEERQKIREDEHKSDWLFERASDRRKHHDEKHHSRFQKQNPRKAYHGKGYRNAYGKVTTP